MLLRADPGRPLRIVVGPTGRHADVTAINRNGRSPQVDAAAYTFVP